MKLQIRFHNCSHATKHFPTAALSQTSSENLPIITHREARDRLHYSAAKQWRILTITTSVTTATTTNTSSSSSSTDDDVDVDNNDDDDNNDDHNDSDDDDDDDNDESNENNDLQFLILQCTHCKQSPSGKLTRGQNNARNANGTAVIDTSKLHEGAAQLKQIESAFLYLLTETIHR